MRDHNDAITATQASHTHTLRPVYCFRQSPFVFAGLLQPHRHPHCSNDCPAVARARVSSHTVISRAVSHTASLLGSQQLVKHAPSPIRFCAASRSILAQLASPEHSLADAGSYCIHSPRVLHAAVCATSKHCMPLLPSRAVCSGSRP